VLGLALALGALLETLHALGFLPGVSFHLALGAGTAVGAALLATLGPGASRLETRVVAALRIAAAFSIVSAAARFAAVRMEAPHGDLTGLSMVLFALAGLGLLLAATRTPVAGWQKL
jgi:hypothetical protein